MSVQPTGVLPRYEGFGADYMPDPVQAAEQLLGGGWRWANYPPVALDQPIAWDLSDQESRSLNFHLHSWDLLDALLRGHCETGGTRYLLPALPVALDWIGRHPPGGTAPAASFAWYDMAVGLRAHRLAYLYDAARRGGAVESAALETLWDSLLQHQAYLAIDANIVFQNNHGYYQVAGQLAMGRRFAKESPLMAEAFTQGRRRLWFMLSRQFSTEGVHLEHSPDYHRMVYETLRDMIEAGLVKDAKTLALAGRIEAALAWFVTPGRRIVNIGDSDYRPLRCGGAESACRWRTPEMRYAATGGQSGQPSAEPFAAFKEGGYFVLRKPLAAEPEAFEKQTYLAQMAAFHSRTHKQADDLSFVWSEGGEDLLVDAGRYGYLGLTEPGSQEWLAGNWYSNPFRMYCESTRAHNTLEFDGQDSPRKGVKPYGSALTGWTGTTEGLVAVETQCRHFGSIRRARVLVVDPGQWLLVFDWFHDNVGVRHQVRQWFHLAHHLRLEAGNEGYLVRQTATGLPLRAASLLDGPVGSRLFLGEREPVIQGWWSPKERDIVPNYAFCYELGAAVSGVFATLFSFTEDLTPDRAWSKVNASGRKAQFRWRDGRGTHELRLDRSGGAGLALSHALRP